MADGPGKYDAMATNVRLVTGARGVVVIVLDGIHGTGFSAHLPSNDPRELRAMLRGLRDVLEQMERDAGI
jgi:hypothetical protein